MLKDSLPIMKTVVPGPKSRQLLKKREQEIPLGIHCDLPLAIARGEGAMIEDVDGNVFLDWTGGVGVLNLEYSRPELDITVENYETNPQIKNIPIAV